MAKFNYAPGLPGYGTQGADGSAGSTGLSMYFSDIDPDTSRTVIEGKILGNYMIWSGADVPLPNGRTYQDGDLFISSEGRIYEIIGDTYVETTMSINISGYFTDSGETAINGASRYSNTNPRYIIDNVMTTVAQPYANYPSEIYGIIPKYFTRIEFTNIDQNFQYNAFSLFSSADGDDIRAIAIVRDINDNIFRIGNADINGLTRNVNITFDVSSLRVTKDVNNLFNANTLEGTVLTNYEMKMNHLVDPVFTYDDGYSSTDTSSYLYYANNGTAEVSIYWDLTRLIDGYDPGVIKADLNIHVDASISNKSFAFDIQQNPSSLVFREIESSGSVLITGLDTDKLYHAYLDVYERGWQRQSKRIALTDAVISTFMIDVSGEINPSWFTVRCPSSAWGFNVEVSSNYSYSVSKIDYGHGTSWLTWSPANPQPARLRSDWSAPHDVSILVSAYSGTSDRDILIRFTPTIGTARGFWVSQPGTAPSTGNIELTAYWADTPGPYNGYKGRVTVEQLSGITWITYSTAMSITPLQNGTYIFTTVPAVPGTYRFNLGNNQGYPDTMSVYIDPANSTQILRPRNQSWSGVAGSGNDVYSSSFTVTAGGSFLGFVNLYTA